MKKGLVRIITAASLLSLSLTSCSAVSQTEGEIDIPIYEGSQNEDYTTVEVTRMDLSSGEKIGAFIGYTFSDALSAAASGNLVSYNLSKYQELKEGDVIAVIDSSALDYAYRRQDIMTQAAYERYLSSGTEAARLEYEYEKSVLDAVQYQIDCYTIRAPYDCVISDAANLTEGQEIEEGTYICSVAHPDEICVYLSESVKKGEESKFKLGAKVSVNLTGNDYEGTVISVPESGAYKFDLKYTKENMFFEAPKSGPVAADSSKNVIIGFEPEVLTALLEDTPNAVVAGWATVNVTTRKMNNVLAVPMGAVSRRENAYVYIVNNGQRIQTPVVTGGTINGYTIITAGLSEGDIISASFK
ncbi:MAG: HlyD family efflux transporter periplasmic adaptor subunit [Ruminococcaceae bacterium]|nr:HlyD family efflux transporter periplasmic adaptor subunit [Oscillospiraceae bacterium]